MKTIIILFIVYLAVVFNIHAQTPQGFNYSAVARDAAGKPLANKNMKVQISILKGNANGAVQYTETHLVNSDVYGLFNLVVGNGSVVTGTLSNLPWGADNYFLKTAIDANGGTNFLTLGTTQLLSVPYAMYANNSGNGLARVSAGGDTLYFSDRRVFIAGKGPKGDKGDTGLQGIQGLEGPKGDKGDTGAQGPQGVAGPTGATGPVGSSGISQWINGLNNSIYYKKGISRVGIGVVNPNAGLDVKRIGNNNLGTIYLANFEALDTTGAQGYDHGAFVRMSTNDYRGRLDLGGSQFNALTTIGSLLHTTGGWQWNTQLNIIGKVGIGTNSPVFPLQVNGNVYLFNRGNKLIFGSGAGLNDSTFAIYRPIGTDGIMMEANDIYIKSRITPIQLQSGSSINMMDLNGNTKMIVNPQTGNVGIGTTLPSQLLSVAGIIETTNGGIKFPDGTIQTTASLGGSSQWTTSGSSIYYNTGNVGVGISTPTTKLHIDGDIRLNNRGQKVSFGDNTCYIERPNGTDGLMIKGNDIYIQSVITPIQLQSGSTINMMDLFGNTKMIVNPQTGNVGIGTSSPARSLHVNSVMRLEPIATAPSSPAKGDMYFDSTINKLRVYDGTSWQNCW